MKLKTDAINTGGNKAKFSVTPPMSGSGPTPPAAKAKRAVTTNEPLRDLVRRIKEHAGLHSFFRTLWDNEPILRLFLAHRRELFFQVPDADFQLEVPFFFFLLLPPAGEQRDNAHHVITTSVSVKNAQRSAIIDGNAKGEAYDEIKKDVREIGSLLLLRFLAKNKTLAQLLKTKKPTLVDVRRALSQGELNLDIVDEFEELQRLWRGETTEVGDQLVTKVLAKYVTKFKEITQTKLSDVPVLLDLLTLLAPLYIAMIPHQEQLLLARKIPPEHYVTILHDLYMRKLVTNLGTVYWCGHCSDEPFVVTSTARLSPKHLVLPCAKCRADTCAGTSYELNPLLMEALDWKDGLLGVAIAWLLEQEEIAYEPSRYINTNNYELDFQFKVGKVPCLLECKMFKSGKDADATKSALRNAVVQAARHAVEGYADTGEPFKRTFVVVNYNLDGLGPVVEQVQKDLRKEIQKHHIEIVSARQVPEILKRLKNPD